MNANQIELFRQEIRHVTHIHKQISTTTDRKSMMEKKNAKLEQESRGFRTINKLVEFTTFLTNYDLMEVLGRSLDFLLRVGVDAGPKNSAHISMKNLSTISR